MNTKKEGNKRKTIGQKNNRKRMMKKTFRFLLDREPLLANTKWHLVSCRARIGTRGWPQ